MTDWDAEARKVESGGQTPGTDWGAEARRVEGGGVALPTGPSVERPLEVPTGEGLARGWTQGYTWGGGDELVAALGAGVQSLNPAQEYSYGQLYDLALTQERERLKQFRKDRPVLGYGSEVAGGFGSAPAVPTFGAPVSLGGRVVQGGLHGTGYGALAGYLSGEGDRRGESAMWGGGIGTPFGAVAPLMGPLARNAWNMATGRSAAARQVGVSPATLDILADNIDPRDLGKAGRVYTVAGPDAMTADFSPTAWALLNTAVNRSGKVASLARQRIDQRVNTATRNLKRTFDRVMGIPQGPKSAAKDISRRTAAARRAAYDDAYSRPIDYSSEAGYKIEGVLNRIPGKYGKAAIDRANEKMQMEGIERAQQIVVRELPDGSVQLIEQPNVMQLDYVKRALDRMGREQVDNFGRRTDQGNDFVKLAGELRDAMVETVEQYGTALRLGGDKIQMDSALELGRDLLKPKVTREMVTEAVKDLHIGVSTSNYGNRAPNVANRGELLKGLRSYIDDTMANVKRTLSDPNVDAREAMKAISDMSTRAARDKMTIALGKTTAKRLFRELDRAGAAFNLRAAVAPNSATFVRTQTNQAVEDIVQGGVLNRMRQGQPVRMGQEAAGALMGRSPADRQRLTEKVYGEIVDFLTAHRGQAAYARARGLLTAQERTLPRAEQVQLMAERIIQGGMVSAPRVGGPAMADEMAD